MDNFKRYKITEIPEVRYGMGGVAYHGYREIKTIQGWARFGHYMLDGVFIWILQALAGFVIGLVTGMQGSLQYGEEVDIGFRLGLTFVNMGILFLYYTIFEIMYSSTPAKMILGRVVIDEYALRPQAGSIMIRSLSRLVPFEAFSCLSDRGWHDRWSKTFVVDKAEAETLWNLINQAERDATYRDAENYRAQQGPDIQ